MAAVVNPFDLKTVLLAKHAQHVVLVHFPIALFLTAVAFDFAAKWTRNTTLRSVAYYNLAVAAFATVPVVITGLVAWRWQLEGHRLKGILLQHLVLGLSSTVLIWIVWAMHLRARRKGDEWVSTLALAVESAAAIVVAVTAHLGGFLSGVNVP